MLCGSFVHKVLGESCCRRREHCAWRPRNKPHLGTFRNCQGRLPRARTGDKLKYLQEPGGCGSKRSGPGLRHREDMRSGATWRARDRLPGPASAPAARSSLSLSTTQLISPQASCTCYGLHLECSPHGLALRTSCIFSAQMQLKRRFPLSQPSATADLLLLHSDFSRALTSM